MEPQADGSLSAEPVAVVGRQIDSVPPRLALQAIDRPRFCWATADASIIGGAAAVTLTAAGPDRFDEIRRAAKRTFEVVSLPADLPRVARPRLFGGFAFHDGHAATTDPPWAGFPGSLFILPGVQLVETNAGTWVTVAAGDHEHAADRLDTWVDRLVALPSVEPTGPPGITDRRPTPDRAGWRAQVDRTLASIQRGDLRKVVLAQALSVALTRRPSIPDVLERLGDTYPDCIRFLVDLENAGTLFGATPEDLVEMDGRDVQTTVLAGSTGRGDTPEEDAWLAADLRESAKDAHEHAVVRQAIHDQLSPYAASVETGDRTVRRLATVQHLETDVRATLGADHHIVDLVEALHPTPAVGGMPQDAALATIRDHESFDRGWYAAPVGWIDAEGDGRFAVAIRSAVASGCHTTLFAGAGIVADSEPDREWSELQLKYRPVLDELE